MTVLYLVPKGSRGCHAEVVTALAGAMRAEGAAVGLLIRKADRENSLFIGFETRAIGSGNVFDVLSPVRIAAAVRQAGGYCVIHAFTPADAALALNARRLCENPSDVKVILSLHDSHLFPTRLDSRQKETLKAVDAVTADAPDSPAAAFCNLTYIAPGMADERVAREEPGGGSPVRLAYIGPLTKESSLWKTLRLLENFSTLGWHLEVAGTGRGDAVMGPVRRTRSAGIDSHITWLGDDFNPMEVLARANAVIGDGSPRTRLMADCAGRPFFKVEDEADLQTLFADPSVLETKGKECRTRYEKDGTFPTFFNRIRALYNER